MASLTKVKINNIDTSVTFVYDPLILLNFGSTQANTDIGFVFNRDGGISSNVALYWDETLDRISVAYTAATGLPNSNVAVSRYANVAADWYFGNLAGGTTNTVWVSANVLPTANAFYNFGSPTQRWNVGYFAATTLDLGGSQISVDPTNGFKFTVGGTGTPIYLAANGALSGTTLSAATTATVGTNLTVGGNITASGFINTSANISGAVGAFGSLNSTGFINTSGNVSAATGSFGAINSTGFFNTSANISAAAAFFGVINSTGYINTTANLLAAVGEFGSINSTGFVNTSGNISAATGLFGAINSTGLINTSANVIGAAGSFGLITSTGLINTSANVSASMFNGGQIYVSGLVNAGGNVLAQSGIFNFLDVNGNIVVGAVTTPGAGHSIIGNVVQSGAGTVYFNTPGNILAAVGQFGAVTSTGFINTSGNISTAQLNAGQINTTGNVIAVRFIGDGGLLTNIAAGGGTNYSNVNVAAYISATGINTSANVLAATGTFNALTVNGNQSVTGFLNVAGNILAQTADVAGIEATGIVYANSTAVTTTSTTGAVRVAGGLGVGGNAVIAGILTVGTTTGINVAAFTDTVAWFTKSANSWAQLGLQNTSTDIGSSSDFIAYANNGDNDSGWIDMGITGQNYVNQNGQYSITGPNDGYLFMSGVSGAGTGGNLVIATGNTGVYNDIVIATGGFDSIHEEARFIAHVGLRLVQGTPSVNPTTGALQVVGGVGIGGNLNVQGDIRLQGNIFLTGNAIAFNTNNLSINDSLIYLADNNTGDLLDIGFIGSFTNPGYQHTGFVRDATDGTWKLFANVAAEPTTTVDFTNATYSNLKIGNLAAVSAGFDGNVTAAYHIGTIGTAAQPLITSLGTLTSLTASGSINTEGNLLAATVAASFLTASTAAVGNISARTIGNVGANIIGGFLNVSGNVLAAAVTASNVFVNGNITTQNYFIGNGAFLTGIVSGGGGGTPGGGTNQIQFNQNSSFAGAASLYYYGANGAVVSNAGISSTSTTTGSFQISGGVGITENINAGGSITAGGLINTSGNVLAAIVSAGSITSTGLINTSANISASQGSFGSVVSTGAINTAGNVLAASGIFNYLDVNGNVDIGSVAVPGAGHNIIGNITQSGAGVLRFNTPGNILAAAGTFNGVTVNGIVSASNVTVAGNVTATYFIGNGAFLTGLVTGGGGGFVYTVSTNPPGTSNPGDVWYDSGTDTIFQRINDGTNTVWVDVAGQPLNVNIGIVQGTSLSITGTGTVTGNLSTGNVLPITSNVYALGSSSNWYTKTWSQAVNALYADLAEKYSSDSDYDPGTVVVFGGTAEVTRSINSHDPSVAGVVSTNPAYLMNSNQEGISVALTGRVPCWVKGPINKGDRVVSSDIPGVGERLDLSKYQPGCIIGKSLESLDSNEIKKIEVVVGRI